MAEYCLRGLRLQAIGLGVDTSSIVCNNKVFRCIEAGLYAAASDYTQASGCRNMSFIGNTVTQCGNNGILNIGSKNCVVQGNTISGCANAGIQCWSCLDMQVIGNNLFDNTKLSYNLIGNLGDSYGAIVIDGRVVFPQMRVPTWQLFRTIQ